MRMSSHNGHYPTPGVPLAAGMQRTSSADYTEVTIEPAPAPQRRTTDPSGARRPHVETVQEESPPTNNQKKQVPVKKKSYFSQAMNYVRGGNDSTSGGSSEESHMKHPQKYHAAVEEDESL